MRSKIAVSAIFEYRPLRNKAGRHSELPQSRHRQRGRVLTDAEVWVPRDCVMFTHPPRRKFRRSATRCSCGDGAGTRAVTTKCRVTCRLRIRQRSNTQSLCPVSLSRKSMRTRRLFFARYDGAAVIQTEHLEILAKACMCPGCE